MARTEVVTITNMCMIYHGDRILVQDKIGDDKWRGITFPGGHVEKGESFTDAVIREVKEETGLTIFNPVLCGVKDWVNDDGSRYMVLLYKTDKFEGELSDSEEGRVYWVDRKDMPEMEIAHDMDLLLDVFTDDDLSEFYYLRKNGKWKPVLK